MAKLTVDGVVYEVNPENNLLQECLSQGLDLPYFCWHPCMGSVGACRQCAVKQYRNEEDKTGTLVMACMTPASDGSIISVKDPQAVKFRASVIESLMISHPHDCPVCEEGGECHLQDMTQMSGHNYRRHDFNKVTHRNQYLGPFINHEMNRCISCYRCVRFYNDYAGGDDLAALASHHHVYFGRHQEGTLQNEFSGNLAEVCPTGVFTDRTFSQHYTRKWDLQTAPSICTGCGVGCNTTPGEREGSVRRIVNRYHHGLNGYFLCDRGRFGHAYTQGPQRLRLASALAGEERQALPDEVAATQLAALRGKRLLGIGSPRASLENNLALREFVGAENFHAGFNDAEHACLQRVIALYRDPALHCPELAGIEGSDCVLLINEDITSTAARMALSVRQATRNEAHALAAASRIPAWQDAAVRSLAQHSRSPLYIIASQGSRLDDVARDCFHARLAEQLALVDDITALLDKAPASSGKVDSMAGRIARDLLQASKPLLVSGISSGSPALVEAAGRLARALHAARKRAKDSRSEPVALCFALPEVNSMGLALLLESGGGSLTQALARLQSEELDALLVLENDLSRRCSAQALAAAFPTAPAHRPRLVVLDQVANDFNAGADLLLPVASFAEQHSTFVNYEGRAQSAYQVHPAAPLLKPASVWLGSDHATTWKKLSDMAPFTGLQQLQAAALHCESGMRSPRQLHRYSGRTALTANLHVHEEQQAADTETCLSFSMEGVPLQKDASLLSAAWAPGWNSNQAISKFQEEINGELRQGCKGVHLLAETTADGRVANKDLNTGQASPGKEELEVFFIQQLFGSEELSSLAPAIEQRSCGAYVSVGRDTASRLGLSQYGRARLGSGEHEVVLPVLIRERIAEDCAGIHCGAELNRHDFTAGASIEPAAETPELIARHRESLRELLVPDRLKEDAS